MQIKSINLVKILMVNIMSHEIDLKKYEIRTDLVDEVIENNNLNDIKISTKEYDDIKVQEIYIDKKNSKIR